MGLVLTLRHGKTILVNGQVSISLPDEFQYKVKLMFEGPGKVLREEVVGESEEAKKEFDQVYEPPAIH